MIASCAVVKTSGQAAGIGEPDGVGHRHELALVDDRELGLPTAADDAHDAITFLEARGGRTEADDLAGHLEAGDVGRRAGRRRITSGQLRVGRRR